jgi:transposase
VGRAAWGKIIVEARGVNGLAGGEGESVPVAFLSRSCPVPVSFSGSPFPVPFADRLKAAGKPFKLIAVACIRKLLSILNVMIGDNQPWRSPYVKSA